ncbi:PCMD domain-containing protein [Sphingobacterium paramultivorum]|uniref:PCMD domain-containing protein n=1 Tax=Sphingobacterium paramultivorum TaxID=2886510 RepID=A0A7G5DZE6_9SPHI|nr:PCMD domain-containing protein [Sphingobacterium paramultivorum]QMV67121.1 PCMD domain-containing protein [Sphingobacterium paramultivorum]WSO15966.1 PCMD domain-containing protein [Sphingobacterium paramultivorum]
MRSILYLFILFSLLCSSCIKDELPNAEADILSCTVDSLILKKDPLIQNDRIQIFVKSFVDLTSQAPVFTLSSGATISPESGTTLDFTNSQLYTVTSQDGKSKKVYEVSYISSAVGSKYSFEHVRTENNKYDVFYELNQDNQNIMDWASGNAGFSLTGAGSKPEDYPTARLTSGKVGQGVNLTTRSTGALGATMGKPLAAGNIFMGEFDLASSIINPLKSLRLGMPVDFVPYAFKGFFKYKAGNVYKEGGTVVSGKKDSWDCYAVFFETDATLKHLDGTNKFTHNNILAIARIQSQAGIETNEWTPFHIPFVFNSNAVVDPQKMKDGKYSLTLVFTSSIDGDAFAGAEGSTLLIDEIEIIHE